MAPTSPDGDARAPGTTSPTATFVSPISLVYSRFRLGRPPGPDSLLLGPPASVIPRYKSSSITSMRMHGGKSERERAREKEEQFRLCQRGRCRWRFRGDGRQPSQMTGFRARMPRCLVRPKSIHVGYLLRKSKWAKTFKGNCCLRAYPAYPMMGARMAAAMATPSFPFSRQVWPRM